ncbi:MAG: GNAT family N-acetyltransferase [Hymenobacteraceae bacterium]|nr:GNAT family N-acetyltransferase [Hymenobacteraceae bacterium]
MIITTQVVEVVKYSARYKPDWDAFVRVSKNGTFLLLRDYMDYHADRFMDHSLLFYRKGKLVALLPANEVGEEVHSHGGLTYGGVISSVRMKAATMLEVFEAMRRYFRELGFRSIRYKVIPHIYHLNPAEEDLYALFRCGAKLYRRDAGAVIDLERSLPYATLRKRKLKKAVALQLAESRNFETFMQVKQQLLQEKYGITPAHSAAELELLAAKFPENIKLYTAASTGELLAGVVIYETATVAHCQYMGATAKGQEHSALDVLIDYLLQHVYPRKKYFSFGISTEQEGQWLNEGLMAYKESYGARAVMHDFYVLEL